MANEGVKIVVDAENKASAKLKDVAKDVKQVGVDVKEVGDRTKASTEAAGALATAFGGDAIGSFAGELAGLTEKMVAFKEQTGASKAGMIAFQGAMVAAAGVIAFKVGKAIGDVIFQTKQWQEELEKAREEAAKLDDQLAASMGRNFAMRREELTLLDAEAEREGTRELLSDIEKQIADKRAQIEAKQNRQESLTEAWFLSPEEREKLTDTTGLEKQLEVLRNQRDTLQDETSERRAALEIAKQQQELEEKRRQAVEAVKASGRSRLKQLQHELELMESQDKIATRIAQSVRSGEMTQFQAGIAETLERKIQNIKDVQAAEKDAKKALVESAKAELKEREDAIKKAEEKAKKEGESTSLSAKGGRLSRTGGVMTSSDKTASNTEKLKEESKEQSKLLQDVVDRLDALTLAQAQQKVYEVIQA